MDEERIAMSQRERDRLKIMASVLSGKRTQAEAARLMGLTARQVRRIQRKLEAEGDAAIIHQLRGRPSNRRICPQFRKQVLLTYRQQFGDFGPTFAAEKLAELRLPVAVRTLREWLVAEGLWQRQRKRDTHRRRRERRPCFGEMVQADGSHHNWLEGRGPWMVLLVMIDDATSKAMARFYPAETTEAYMDLLGRYLRKHGRMGSMYVDRDSIFRAEDHHPSDPRPTLTQFKRALEELQIELILANSPQAKGRVERFNKTAQDRLVKELRLAGATTMEEANVVVETVFLPWFNRRCTVRPSSPNSAHRPLHPSMNLGAILSLQDQRKVANDYTIRLDNVIYQLLPPALAGLRGGKVTIEKRLDGSLKLRFKGQYVKYEVVGSATASGALPPNPRSLSQTRTPAERKKKGSAAATAEPSAVRPAKGRSGRTPAEPCLPDGVQSVPQTPGSGPSPDHPWRQSYKRMKTKKTNRTILPAATTGHS
ncbi:MAG: ISNCY family transposase [Phycisphaerae bacterium]|nr:ISNCY family transposase [Phycisphaerae bacterium]